MNHRHVVLIGVLLGVPCVALAQDVGPCFEMVILDGEWVAGPSQAEPPHDFDPTTPLLQVPERFAVSDSLTRRGGRAILPLPGSNSVFRSTNWTETSDGVVAGWVDVDVGWVAEIAPSADPGDSTWSGTLQRGGNAAFEGRWIYRIELNAISCPAAQLGDS